MAKKAIIPASETERVLEKMGLRIKNARLRRNITAEEIADRAGISKGTLTSIEKGMASVSIGAYASVLYVLGMEKDLELVATDEEGKQKFEKMYLKKRERAAKGRTGDISRLKKVVGNVNG